MKTSWFWSIAWLALACGNPAPEGANKARGSAPSTPGELVTPPFEVKGDAEGLLLVWYDERGEAQTATRRADVPEARRATVRVDALELAPEQRLDPAYVLIADLRRAAGDGRYPVRKLEREAFEASLASAGEQREHGSVADVIIYGASWCGACKQAAQYFTRKGVPYLEKDIEKQPEARSEMLAKAKAQGVNAGGIPVIDVRGTLMGGFNAQRIDQLLRTN